MCNKPHICFHDGKWLVAGTNAANSWDTFTEACSFALNIFSWDRYQCSGAHEAGPLHKQWRALQTPEFLANWESSQRSESERKRRESKRKSWVLSFFRKK
jgi:hypothetical protein